MTCRPEVDLRISQQRIASVLHGLVAHGIPAERFHLLAKGELLANGEAELAVPTPASVPGKRHRRVETQWQ